MGILDRMGRALSTQFNALLDQAEDPNRSVESLLSQLQVQLKAAQRELVRVVASERQLAQQIERLEGLEQRWQQRAELALENRDEALAKAALERRQEVHERLLRARKLHGAQRANALEMRDALSAMRGRYQDWWSRRRTLAAQLQRAKGGGTVEGLGGDASAFEAFRSIEQDIESVDDAMDAAREVEQVLGEDRWDDASLRQRFALLEEGSELEKGYASASELEGDLVSLKKKLRVPT